MVVGYILGNVPATDEFEVTAKIITFWLSGTGLLLGLIGVSRCKKVNITTPSV
jgi:hypothetical protein